MHAVLLKTQAACMLCCFLEDSWQATGLAEDLHLWVQASKQVLDRMLPSPISYADLCAIAGAVGVYNTHGPLMNVGYGRPDVDGPDPFQGVGSNTNQQRDYPIQELINEWGELSLTGHCQSRRTVEACSSAWRVDVMRHMRCTLNRCRQCHAESVCCVQSTMPTVWRS